MLSNRFSQMPKGIKTKGVWVFKMKKKSGKKWIMAAVTAAVCVMMAGCGDAEGEVKSGKASSGDTAVATSGGDTEAASGKTSSEKTTAKVSGGGKEGDVTFKNATSWGYSGQNIWLFKDGKLAICVDTGETPKGEILEEIPYASIRSVCLNAGVKMEEDWFADCDNLVSVYGDVEEIAEGCFSECDNLTSVELPNATEIGRWAFRECSSLTSIELPNVITIEMSAFEDCDSHTDEVEAKIWSLRKISISTIFPPPCIV